MKRVSPPRRPGMPEIVLGLLGSLAAATAAAAGGSSHWPGEWTFNGFLSQGYSLSNANDFNSSGQRGGSFDFREAAVNGRWQIDDRVSAAAQVLYREVPASVDDDLRLDYAFVDYTYPGATGNYAFGITLGRFKNPFGFYNEFRDVPFTRPGVLLPQSMYTERGRPFAMASQGVLVHADLFSDWGTLGFKGSFGEPIRGGSSLEFILFGTDVNGEFEPEQATTAQLRFDGAGVTEGWSGALSYLYYAYDFSRPQALGLDAYRFSFRTGALSVQYATPEWRITAETAVGVSFDDVSRTSGYLQGTYRLSPALETFVRYDLMIIDTSDRWGKAFAASGRGPAHNRYAKDLTFGVNWDVTPDIALRAEWHHVEGTSWLSPAEINLRDADKRWNLGIVELSFRF